MNKNIYKISALIACCSAVISCTRDDIKAPSMDFGLALHTEIAGMPEPGTKATLLNDVSGLQSKTLKLYAWEDSSPWLTGSDVTYSAGKWTVADNPKIKDKKSYVFLSYANMPSSGAGITMPSAEGGNVVLEVSDITTAQTDVLIGSGSVSNPTSGDVDINYSHPFASVKFILGNASGVTTVSGISLTGVYTSGKTTFNKDSGSGGGVTPYTWTNLGNANATLEATGLSAAEGDSISTFVVIPQNLSDKNAVMTITYDGGSTMTKLLSDGSWTAGYTTTYTLNNIISVSVSITGVDNIKNTGESKIYVRASIAGAWYDSSDNIVDTWDYSQGTFTGLPGSGWTKSGDIYYYSVGLAKNETATALYTSYSPIATPVTGATLKLDVLIQAIPYDVNKTCQEAFAAIN